MLARSAVLAIEAGQYISIWKPLVLLAVIVVWVKLLTWADKDAEDAHLPRMILNPAFAIGLLAAVFLSVCMPGFIAGLGVLIGVFFIEGVVYLVLRNKEVGLKDLGDELRQGLRSTFGRKEKIVKVQAGQLGLIQGGSILAPPESESPDLLGYQASQKILTEPMTKGASAIRVVPSANGSTVRYVVDGYPYEATAVSREESAAAATYLKSVVGLDISERRKPQVGKIKATFSGKKHELRIGTTGSTAGESLAVDVDPASHFDFTLDRLGLTPDQFEEIDALVKDPTGIVILSAPNDQGLTNLLYAVVRRHDAFLQHIQTIERAPESELEGIRQNKLPAQPAAGEEAKLVSWVVSQEPDVLMIGRVDDQRSAAELVKFAASGRRAYIGMRAASTFEALINWQRLAGEGKDAMKVTRLVVNGRLLRTLCQACKQEYSPDPDTLRKLNMSPDRVGTLFQARTTPMRDPKGHPITCGFCNELHFKGRIGVYELLAVDDQLRKVMQSDKPEESINRLKMIFKSQKRKYLQEQAVALAIAGETSLHEVARVLKASSGPARTPPKGGTAK